MLPGAHGTATSHCRIFWIGKKKTTGRVILYCHGGAFITPLMSSMCTYWHKIQQEHEKVYGEEIGIAVLEYSLWPVSFPTQLLQLVQAVEHLVQTGIQPSELFLSGDSAGANLVLQFISHVLHPLPSLPQSTLTEPLAGMILLSPWISFTSSTPSHRSNAHFDICSTGTLSKWGSAYLEPIADGERIYAEPARAPPKWFSGMKEVVERMFITAGGSEVLRDDIGLLCETLSKVHPAVIFEMEENGVHNESIFGMMVGSTKSRVLGMIVEWLPGYLDRGRVANSVHRYK
ncbi:Alpha/Beta hydrolase protein [Cyathus striatus]|nr:Alpha/Beta hydrolase protein [Cyathus striatus]